MNVKYIPILFAVFFVASCSTAPSAPTVDPITIQQTAEALAWQSVTQTVIANYTATPTQTPIPTSTPIPTATNTPIPQPKSYTGTGDTIIDIDWDGPGYIHAKYAGGSNFAIINYGPNNEYIDLLVNTIGNYEGNVPLNFLDSEDTKRLEVKASGTWEITIYPLALLAGYTLPVTISGTGDDVFILFDRNGDIIKADNSQGSSNFAVWAYSPQGRELVFNEISPYTGSALLPSGTMLMVVKAEGNWTLEISTK